MRASQLKKEFFENNPDQKNIIKRDIGFQIGRMITHARIISGMTQQELAKSMKTKQPSIARAENGSSLPSLAFLVKMAKSMNTFLIPPRFDIVPDFFSEDYSNKKVTTVSSVQDYSYGTYASNEFNFNTIAQVSTRSNSEQKFILQIV